MKIIALHRENEHGESGEIDRTSGSSKPVELADPECAHLRE
jgi:hypothetical protein